MFGITHNDDAPIPTLDLSDDEASSRVTLAPARGGMVTRFEVGGHQVFYLDQESFEDTSRNVRGGNPVLFPSPGKLTGDRYRWRDASGAMKQHGFGRITPWEVSATSTDADARATLRLASSPDTRAVYPFDFEARFTYILKGHTLRIEMAIDNTGQAAMPFGIGFHPYFYIPQAEKASTRVSTRATRAFDNAAGQHIAFDGFDLTAAEVDLHLDDHGSTRSAIAREGAPYEVVIQGSEGFTHFVVWTLSGRDFVCVEPWTCPGDALNTGQRLEVLEPGASSAHWLEYRVALRA